MCILQLFRELYHVHCFVWKSSFYRKVATVLKNKLFCFLQLIASLQRPCMFSKFWKIPETRLLWSSFLQKQALAGSWKNNCSKQLFVSLRNACECTLNEFHRVCFTEKYAEVFGQLFFSKHRWARLFTNSNSFFRGTPMNAFEWMRKS